MIASKTCNTCHREYHTETDFLSNTSRWRKCSVGNLWFNCNCGSTLILPKGKYDWYSPEKALGNEALTVFNQISILKDLPHIPAQVLEIQRLVTDGTSHTKEIADAIKQDPFVAAQLLTIAQNIASNRNPGNPPMQSIEHAVVYLGLHSVGELVLTSALRQFKFPDSTFNFERFWHESHLCGAIAEFLNKNFQFLLNEDEVYLAASMCNLGKLVTAFSFPSLVSKIQNDVNSPTNSLSWNQAETSYNFPDHRILGEIAASVWGFPSYIAEAARRHHTEMTPSPKIQLFELVAVANQIVHWVLLSPSRIEPGLLESFYKKSGKTEKDIEKCIPALSKINAELLKRSTGH
jgi:HD-like signal output (HDOD) protein